MRKDVDFFLFLPHTSLVPWHFFTLTCDGFRQNHYLWVQQMRMDREWSRPRNLKTTTADHAEVLPWFQGYYLLQLPRGTDGCLSLVGTKPLKLLCAKQWHPEWTMTCAFSPFSTISPTRSGYYTICQVCVGISNPASPRTQSLAFLTIEYDLC